MLVVLASCRDLTSPIDPGLSGRWMEYGIDTYARLDLEKRGTRVTGTYTIGSVGASALVYPVLGVAAGQRAILRWKEGSDVFTFDVTLPSADSDKLTGKWIVNGESTGNSVTFTRNGTFTSPAVVGP